ncbi:MAG: LysM peptidoglycan-binding domain-containing M23 family metallopeptidase [Dehalococcoidia bacterium]|nr:LysM peptidoglycan-binding domain-containing M23 family metallopeptidase [Dehalococcoidia bacterium]
MLPGLHFSIVGALLGLILMVGAFPVQVSDLPSQPALSASRVSLPGLAAAVPTASTQSLAVNPVPLTLMAVGGPTDIVTDGTDRTEETLSALEGEQASSSAPASLDGNETNEKIPIFFEYEVSPGDTLGQIADRFGVRVDHIVWNNSDVQNANDIAPGQRLQIPSVPGIIHSVRVDETVTEIADRYDADWREIVEFRANGLDNDPNNILPSTLILVPGGRRVPLEVALPDRPGTGSVEPGAGGWAWPVAGALTSPYGPAHPLGIDIAAPVGSTIYAATSGTVTFVGGNPCCSYGYHVIIDHGNGYETLYAHLSDFAVGGGQYVNAGEAIGWIGMTGRTTGPHVHFEVRRNGVYQNPLIYLP